ncbi:CHAT domain-containing protein [Rhodococcus erythropolis]|uniref:CHAT domain-containing protein n=1 Tax=Rhodococcus erythropolis TaxID=1833 RepID=UPI003A4D470F
MTPTALLLASIEDEFVAESHRDYSAWSLSDLAHASDRQIGQANVRVTRSVSPDEAHELARIYGRWLPAARQRDQWTVELRVRSGLAHILMQVIVPNRDEARMRASEIFEQIGNECTTKKDKPGAAIALTNSALAILQMHNATQEQIQKARQMCVETKRMRKKGSVDFAYSQMNLALAERLAIRFSQAPDKSMQFKNVLRSFDQAYRLFKKNDHLSSQYKAIYHQNVLETLNDLIDYETNRTEEKLFPPSIPENLDDDSIAEDLGRVAFVRALRSNPHALGFDRTPEWVPSHDEIIRHLVATNPELSDRIAKVKEFVRTSSKAQAPLQIRLFQTETAVAGALGVPDIPWESLEETWRKGEVESYFLTARSILTWTESASFSPQTQYLNLLERIHECLLIFRRSWSVEDIRRLIERNPLTFRFTGCAFAQLSDWKSAFLVLEASRGLVSSKTLDSDPLEHFDHDDSISWIHITHSPNATYCIMRQGVNFSGIALPELSGSTLTARFINLTAEMAGPLSVGPIDRRRAVASAEEIGQLLEPISAWITSNAGPQVALIPGGFYQAFPIWACGTLGNSVLDGTRRVFTVPSREISIKNAIRKLDSTRGEVASIKVLDASSIPGQAQLKWSPREKTAIRKLMSQGIEFSEEDATRTSVLDSFNLDDIVHFTGHSVADLDPLQSRLLTYSGDVTCEDILDRGITSRLVLFDSCESGLARNAIMQDEMLTLSTAAYYAGADLVIDTSWTVYDPPAFAFTAKFYESLGGATQVTFSSVYQAYVHAVSWLKKATLSDLDGLRQEYGVPVGALSGSDLAFTFYDWSAFGVVGIDLN